MQEGKEMALEVGAIVEGKINGITKFGAFVSLPEGKSGLVHISEISNSYVSEISEHVSVGQSVKVYVMNIAPDGKINLSIKRAEAPAAPQKPQSGARYERNQRSDRQERPSGTSVTAAVSQTAAATSDSDDFEDKLKKFMRESDSRIADNRMYSEHRQRSRRR